ncbi:MAG: DNA polymerase I [Muribaculaceae bacterium]|nr:DNA polymerase I [Muribaculaceae bacterium]
MSAPRLFLLDAYGLIYRAYYGLINAPRFTAKGLNTSAIYGFCNTLMEVLRKEEPDYIAVCFDPPKGHTFRHDVYPEYKAGRAKQPEDITNAVPYIERILEAFRIPILQVENYEADDLIGTLSCMATKEGLTTYMMTLDKDFGQLVNDHVFMYRPALKGEGFEVRGPEQICERYGLKRPLQVIDILALEGDASDNIPGCPGVGEKTAKTLVAEWDTVENLIDNVASLKGALQRKIQDNAEQIVFSKFLATIKTDVPLPEGFSLSQMKRNEPDLPKLREIFTELEFKTLLSRLPAQAQGPAVVAAPAGELSLFDLPDEPAAAAPAVEMKTVASADLDAALQPILQAEYYAAIPKLSPAETPNFPKLLGLYLAADEANPIYVELPENKADRESLRRLFDALAPTVISHDVKSLMTALHHEGMMLANPYFDTAIADYLLNPETAHTLSHLATRYLSMFQPLDAPTAQLSVLLALRPKLQEALDKEPHLTDLYRDIELPLVRVLAEMEWTGVSIDISELRALSATYSARIAEMEAQAYELAGQKFNVASPAQVGEILFDRLKLDAKAKRTASGSYSTTEKILEKLRPVHPIVDLILKIRRLRKLVSTYLDALPNLVNPATHKIHTTFNQTVTATGRISSTNPNLQNIPIRTEEGREIRRAFVPDDGCLIMSADYSQIELRLIADFSRDPNMVDAFLHDFDIHRATASKIYHLPMDQVTDDQRRNAKTANFGTIYGISAFGLSERLGIPRSEAKELITNYFNTYPDLRSYIDQAIEKARQNGYVETIFHRRRYLPDINSRNAVVRQLAERNAVNAPLQGSAADIIKIAMIAVSKEIHERGLRSQMIVQVHDELLFNIVPDEAETMKELVVRHMENAWKSLIPLSVSVGMGPNWLEAAH